MSNRAPVRGTPTQPATVVGLLQLNAKDRLRVALDQYGGRHIVDIRKWFEPGDGGELRATPKGISLDISRLPALATMINDALVRARAEGLLPDIGGASC
jgi:hypothetical protein